MKDRLLQILNIRPSESNYLSDLLPVQLFLGLANSYINIVAFALFIDSFSLNRLPQAYIIIAVGLLIVNIFYERLEKAVSPLQLLKWIIVFSTIVLFFIWTGLYIWNPFASIFILVIWATLIYMITGYAYWGIVSSLFNIRESKRVFSVAGAGDMPAKLVGYLSAPLLISLIGVNNLILASIISLLAGLLVFHRVTRKPSWDNMREKTVHEHHTETIVKCKGKLFGFFFKNELIFAISLLSLLSYNVFNLIDYTFLSQVKLHYEDKGSLASFLAIFFAFGRVTAIILKLVFSSRVISRLGIISTLFITPVVLFIFCIVLLLTGNKEDNSLYLFGLMAALSEVLRSTMQEPVFFMLFQPLREHLRLKGHIISKGYMLPPSLIIVGFTLFILLENGFQISILFIIKVLIINLLLWAVIIFFIRKAYLKTLHDSIKKGMYTGDEIRLYDQESVNILLNKISSGNRSEVVYALKLLEQAQYTETDRILSDQLGSAEKDIVIYALERLDARKKTNVTRLKQLLETEQNPDVREKLVYLVCKYDTGFLAEMAKHLPSYALAIRKAVIISLLNQREFTLLYQAGKEINRLLYSSEAMEREMGVSIIGSVKHVRFTEALKSLISDEDRRVRRASILTSCRLKIKSLLPDILQLLADSSDKYLAMQGMIQYGDDLFIHIKPLHNTITEKQLSLLVRVAGKIKGPHSVGFLLQVMEEYPALNNKIIQALSANQYTTDDMDLKNRFQIRLKKYLDIAIDKIHCYVGMPDFNGSELVNQALENEIRYDVITALQLCGIIYAKSEISGIIESVESGRNKNILNAVEMIALVIPPASARQFNILFDFLLDVSYRKSAKSVTDGQAILKKIIITDAPSFNQWTKSICIYTSVKSRLNDFLPMLKNQPRQDDELIITETAGYAFSNYK